MAFIVHFGVINYNIRHASFNAIILQRIAMYTKMFLADQESCYWKCVGPIGRNILLFYNYTKVTKYFC